MGKRKFMALSLKKASALTGLERYKLKLRRQSPAFRKFRAEQRLRFQNKIERDLPVIFEESRKKSCRVSKFKQYRELSFVALKGNKLSKSAKKTNSNQLNCKQ